MWLIYGPTLKALKGWLVWVLVLIKIKHGCAFGWPPPGTGWSLRHLPTPREVNQASLGHLEKPSGMLASHEKKCIFVADTCGALHVNCFNV